jgi:predicted  nucleic acid-binding Zn-ribbon protein
MRIEATVQEIRSLLELAELDLQEPQLPPDAYRTRREAARSRVASAILERYEALLEAGRSPGVVAIRRGSCSGCHVRLPTMLEYRALRAPALHACPHCRRLLYAPELLGEQPAREQPPRKKAARRRAPTPAAERS